MIFLSNTRQCDPVSPQYGRRGVERFHEIAYLWFPMNMTQRVHDFVSRSLPFLKTKLGQCLLADSHSGTHVRNRISHILFV